MEYQATSGTVYKLAEMDDELLTKQDAVDKATDMHARAKACWAFLMAALPAGALKAELGTDEQRKASVPRTFMLYQGVKAAYWREYDEARLEDVTSQVEQLKGMTAILEAMGKATEAIGQQSNRQVFRAVK